eukprot:3924338-Rhodomonas_salina.1
MARPLSCDRGWVLPPRTKLPCGVAYRNFGKEVNESTVPMSSIAETKARLSIVIATQVQDCSSVISDKATTENRSEGQSVDVWHQSNDKTLQNRLQLGPQIARR